MGQLRIPEEEIQYAMTPTVFDLITVIPKDELLKGIAFIRSMIAEFVGDLYTDNAKEEEASHERWDKFWDGYFMT